MEVALTLEKEVDVSRQHRGWSCRRGERASRTNKRELKEKKDSAPPRAPRMGELVYKNIQENLGVPSWVPL